MKKTDYLYKALVTNVVDGDTIDVLIQLGFDVTFNTRLRLAGVDTPEKSSRDPYIKEAAYKATAFVSDLVLGREVTLITSKPDKYGRYLADVYVGDIHVNAQLISEGFAVSYDGGKKA